METVRKEGARKVKRNLEYYNLDLVLSVGYRVNSKKATHFRQWATRTLKEYIVKGYSINPHQIKSNYEQFLKAVEDVKRLLPVVGECVSRTLIAKQFTEFYKRKVDPKADTFFIEPDENNPRAFWVYEKAGFQMVGKYEVKDGTYQFFVIEKCTKDH